MDSPNMNIVVATYAFSGILFLMYELDLRVKEKTPKVKRIPVDYPMKLAEKCFECVALRNLKYSFLHFKNYFIINA